MRRIKGVLLSSITLMLSAFILAGCMPDARTEKMRELDAVQIKEYKGEKLGAISDFRDNSIKGSQNIDPVTYKLKVTGLIQQPVSFSYDEAIGKHQNYKKVVTLDCVEGWSVKVLWEGILIKDLLSEAGVLPDAKVVIFHAYDGYTTSLPLQYITDNDILLAYKMNDVVLPPIRGFPFQLVAEQKWGYKWIKWVTEIEISNNENYRGYWEEAGYSNDADVDKPFFEK